MKTLGDMGFPTFLVVAFAKGASVGVRHCEIGAMSQVPTKGGSHACSTRESIVGGKRRVRKDGAVCEAVSSGGETDPRGGGRFVGKCVAPGIVSKSSIILSTAEGAKRAKICLLFCVLRDLCGEGMRTEFMTIYLFTARIRGSSRGWRRRRGVGFARGSGGQAVGEDALSAVCIGFRGVGDSAKGVGHTGETEV